MLNQLKFGKDLWDPSHRFETSWLVGPYVLFVIRALLALYCFVTLVFLNVWFCLDELHGGCMQAKQQLAFFTTLSYWGLAFYFLIAAIHTFTYARSGHALLDSFPRPLQALHSAFYTSIVTLPLLVTIIFWTLLYKSITGFPSTLATWNNISVHAMNSLFALFEIFIPRTDSPPFLHFVWLLIILVMYLALANVYVAIDPQRNSFPYSFLDSRREDDKTVAGYVFAIVGGTLVVFAVVKGLIWVRKWVTEKKLGQDGKYTRHGSVSASDTEIGRVNGTNEYRE